MKYKIIEKPRRGDIIIRGKGIGITKNTISFHRGFTTTYGRKRYVEFAENEEGYLCFRTPDEKEQNAYTITTSKKGISLIHMPTVLQKRILDYGRYEVTQDGEWFVTNCKLK